jgi:predicted transcriptional regulator
VTVSVNLPAPAVEALQRLATKRGTTRTEILRHAISLAQQLDHEIAQGARIIIEKDGKFSELVVWP